jgi:MFS family permease
MKVLASGVFSLVLTLGIGRFAYTPMLLLMQQQAGLSVTESGWLATVNYMGYFSGALIAAAISDLTLKDRLFRLGLLVAVLSTAAMAFTQQVWLWAFWRYLAGLGSAAGLLLGSGLILNWLLRHGYRNELGIHFSGMGLGIVLCAVLVDATESRLPWDQQWLVLAVIGVLLALPAWRWLPRPKQIAVSASSSELQDNIPPPAFMRLFMLAYFAAGIAFAVGTTYIVAQVATYNGGDGLLAFLIMGIAAAPACIIWDYIARALGAIWALQLAYGLQIAGLLLSLAAGSQTLVLFGAALFGFTFIGTVSLVLTMAGSYCPQTPGKMMGRMTQGYGIAQIAAPVITAYLAAEQGAYAQGFVASAVALALGMLAIAMMQGIERSQTAEGES